MPIVTIRVSRQVASYLLSAANPGLLVTRALGLGKKEKRDGHLMGTDLKKILLHYGLERKYILRRKRDPNLVFDRAKVWRELRKLGHSIPAIAKEFKMNHATVINGLKKFKKYNQPKNTKWKL